MIQAICFDLNGTLFDLSRPPAGVTEDMVRAEVAKYLTHIKKPEWSPLAGVLPSWWSNFPLFDDVVPGVTKLGYNGFRFHTLSNNPREFQITSFVNSDWCFPSDRVVDLSRCRVYKPNQKAYDIVAGYLRCPHSEIAVVTANESFGDLEGARKAGLRPILLERYGPKKDPNQESYRDCIDLAEALLAEALLAERG